jgi:hypothetical protein
MAPSAACTCAALVLLFLAAACAMLSCARLLPARASSPLGAAPLARFQIYVGGEPTPWESPAPYDLCILAGGHNLYPNAFHLPLLALEKGWKYEPPPERDHAQSRPIDVLFRSSARCDHPRVAFAAHIQRRCEERNLRFVSVGRCLDGRGDAKSWGECDACTRSKVILALEAFQPGAVYLSEKPFLPLAMGAAGVYVGNGADLLGQTGANPDRFIYAGADYSPASAEAAARAIVRWLETPAQVQHSLSQPAFRGVPLSPESLDMRAVHAFLRGDPKLGKLRQARRALRCFFEGGRWSLLQHPAHLARMLGVREVVECDALDRADIVLKHCCAD